MPPTSPKSPKSPKSPNGVRGGPIGSVISKQKSDNPGTKILITSKADMTANAQHKLSSDAEVLKREKAIKAQAQAEADITSFNQLHDQLTELVNSFNQVLLPETLAIYAQTLQTLQAHFSDLNRIFQSDYNEFAKQRFNSPHPDPTINTITRILYMINGISCLQPIAIQHVTVFEHEYPDIERIRVLCSSPLDGDGVFVPGPLDLPLDDPAVDVQGAARQASQEQMERASADVQQKERIPEKEAKVINSYIETKLNFYKSNRAQKGTCGGMMNLLMKRLTEGPNGKYLRVSPDKLKKMITEKNKSTQINIPKLQLKLYKEFMDAINRYRTIPLNKSKYALIELLFVRIQRVIRDFCIVAVEEWSTGMCPGDFATYMHSHHHYFNFFKIFYTLTRKLQPIGVPNDSVIHVIRFLCKSVFILLCDTHITAVIDFIVRLRSIADQINHPSLKGPHNVDNRKKWIVHLLEPVRAELSSNMMTNKSVIRSIFFRYFIAYIPEYIWLQRLIIEDDDNDEVFVTKDEWDSILRVEFSLDAEVCDSSDIGDCSQSSSSSSGGGRTKKRGHTNKSKKNIKNKKSGHNKKVRGNKKSRRNQKRS